MKSHSNTQTMPLVGNFIFLHCRGCWVWVFGVCILGLNEDYSLMSERYIKFRFVRCGSIFSESVTYRFPARMYVREVCIFMFSFPSESLLGVCVQKLLSLLCKLLTDSITYTLKISSSVSLFCFSSFRLQFWVFQFSTCFFFFVSISESVGTMKCDTSLKMCKIIFRDHTTPHYITYFRVFTNVCSVQESETKQLPKLMPNE